MKEVYQALLGLESGRLLQSPLSLHARPGREGQGRSARKSAKRLQAKTVVKTPQARSTVFSSGVRECLHANPASSVFACSAREGPKSVISRDGLPPSLQSSVFSSALSYRKDPASLVLRARPAPAPSSGSHQGPRKLGLDVLGLGPTLNA
jgi:hypothetical protein